MTEFPYMHITSDIDPLEIDLLLAELARRHQNPCFIEKAQGKKAASLLAFAEATKDPG